jgi:phosphate transport system protein
MDKHLSSQFDADLQDLCNNLMTMGGLVEQQLDLALVILNQQKEKEITRIFEQELSINQLELDIDQECNQIIVRRQPIASDLRLLMAVSKITANLERAGDEALKIAKCTHHILTNTEQKINLAYINHQELKSIGELAQKILHKALDAFARSDVQAAIDILQEDQMIDSSYQAFARKLISYMIEKPQTITVALELLSIAKAVERIGDHAKNIAEYVIYVVKGMDIRHLSLDEKQRQAMMQL